MQDADEEEFTVGDGFGGEAFGFGTVGGSSEGAVGVDLGTTYAAELFEERCVRIRSVR